MSYTIEITKQAQDDLRQLDKAVLQAVRKRLKRLAENADQIQHLSLTGQFSGLYKLRAYGKYRIIYDIQRDAQRIVVVRVGKRSDIYDE